MSDEKFRIGIDLGGTKMEIVVLDAANGKEIYRKRTPTKKDNYKTVLNGLVKLIHEAEKEIGEKASIGIGLPGCVSRDTGLIKNSNIVQINGEPLKKDLEAALKREVKIQNDANCFAVSEAVDGAGAGAEVVFGAIIGTGCGGGIAINRRPLSGRNMIAGEWGHNPLPYPRLITSREDVARFSNNFPAKGPVPVYENDDSDWIEHPGDMCFCGKRGCLETWISGTGFKNDYARVTGEALSTHDIIANAKDGEEKAVAALTRYTDRLARALAGVMNILDPDVIVLGGGMSNVDSLYEDVPKIWQNYVFSDIVNTKLVPPRYGDSSGVRGAAWLWQ